MGVGKTVLGGVCAIVVMAAALTLLPQSDRPATTAGTVPPIKESLDLDAIETAWRAWLEKHDIRESAMAVGADAEVLGTAGLRRDPDAPYPVASLSKSITAICMHLVLAEADMGWDTTLSDLAEVTARQGLRPVQALQTATLAQVVTHTAGLYPDLTQGNIGRNMAATRNIARRTVTAEGAGGDPGQHQYSNTNYAVLGALIEGMTAQTYNAACRARVTAPAGAAGAGVFGPLSSTSSYGGWSVSARDYARIAMHWFGPDRPWVKAPWDYAYDPGAGYGLGVRHASSSNGHVISHYGIWTFDSSSERNAGALFMVTHDGVAFTANWGASIDNQAYNELYLAVLPHLSV